MFVVETGSQKIYTSASPQPSAPLATDWLVNAVNHYVQNFVLQAENGLPGMYNEVPRLCTLSPGKEYLQSAFQAVALCHIARVNRMGPEHLRKAQRLHGEAIRGLRTALNDEAEARSATALMTTELLWQYDLILGVANSSTGSPHQQGMLRILQIRLRHGSHDSFNITKAAFISFVLNNIGQRAPAAIIAPAVSLYPCFPPERADDIACTYLGMMCHAMSLHRSIPAIDASYEDVASYVAQVTQLNADILEWETFIPEDWKYNLYMKPLALDQEEEYPQMIISFPNVNTMILWITFWMTRLEILQCFDQLHVITPQSVTLSSDMSFLVDLICAAIPQMTGQTIAVKEISTSETVKHLASLFAMRSLFLAGQVRNSPTVKTRWILQQLEYIGRQKGIGQALELVQYLQSNWNGEE
ncbi:hypothetical protein DE146DRAFT_48063 [Phaeosphaeria sp. MPI-PUGE-AT-0046c]|nr:hypothetical protein DE146DRAFT_48063 [Phaeosphaeria sp. MPI-PUGE-AT-0046c]